MSLPAVWIHTIADGGTEIEELGLTAAEKEGVFGSLGEFTIHRNARAS